MGEPHWFTRDHALVIQAAANLDDSPAYSEQLWSSAGRPQWAALSLLAMLIKERGLHLKFTDPEDEAYAAGYGDGLEAGRGDE